MGLLRPLALLPLLLPLLLTGACSSLISTPRTHEDVRPEEFERAFLPRELAEDLRFLVDVCEEVHPRPYALRPREEIEALREALERRIQHPLTRREFWPLAAQLAAALGDDHTSLLPPFEEWNAFASTERLLPLAVEARAGRLVIVRSLAEGGPPPGAELRRVNGIDLRESLSEYPTLRAGEPAFAAASFSSNLHMHLWLAGARAPFEVHTDDGRGECTVYEGLEGMTAQEIQAKRSAVPARANWTLHWLEGGVAWIDFRSMTDGGAWKDFLRATFDEIRAKEARGVIVDLRRNGGGDSTLGERLLAYLDDKPYRMASRKEWRSSARYRAHLKNHLAAWLRWLPLQYLHPFGRAFWGAEEGEIVVLELEEVTPEVEPRRFDGPWCLLIGPATFSSAMMLANAVGDFGLAPLFGAETGGVPNAFGEIYSCDLPNSRLQLQVSSAYFVRANGDGEDRRGVLPTHPVVSTPEDDAAGRDPTLEAARAWLLEQARP